MFFGGKYVISPDLSFKTLSFDNIQMMDLSATLCVCSYQPITGRVSLAQRRCFVMSVCHGIQITNVLQCFLNSRIKVSVQTWKYCLWCIRTHFPNRCWEETTVSDDLTACYPFATASFTSPAAQLSSLLNKATVAKSDRIGREDIESPLGVQAGVWMRGGPS